MWTTIGIVFFAYIGALFFLLKFFRFIHDADEQMHDSFTQNNL